MQAIITKYYGPTNTRAARLIAKCDAGTLTMSYDSALNVEQNHYMAALRLAHKLGWTSDAYGDIASGTLPDGSGAHVFVSRAPARIIAG